MVENLSSIILMTIIENQDEIYNSLIICISIFSIYMLIFYKQFISIFDPLVALVAMNAFSAFFPVYMYINNIMYTDEFFIQFCLTEVFFVIGFMYFQYIRCDLIKKILNTINNKTVNISVYNIKNIFYLLSTIYVISTVTYVFFADTIPLFAYLNGDGSRLNVNQHNIPVFISSINMRYTFIPSWMSLIYLIFNNIKINKLYIILFLIVSTIGSSFSGSKIFLLSMINVIFFMLYYKPKSYIFQKHIIKKYLFILCIMSIVIISCMYAFTGDSIAYIPIGIGYRLLSCGNIFYLYAYSFTQWIVTDDNIIIYLFNQILTQYHIVSWNDVAVNIGYQAELLHNPYADLSGPNSRHNIVGLLYLGTYGSVFFSLILGLILGFFRRLFFLARFNSNFPTYFIVVVLYITWSTLPAGPSEPFLSLVNTTLYYGMLYVIYHVCKSFVKI